MLLVEGDSDLLYLKEVGKLLNREWNFDYKNISIVIVNGKTNIKRFVDFYKSFDITPYILVDSDALIDGFEKLDVSDPQIIANRSKLMQELDNQATHHYGQIELPSKKIKDLSKGNTWHEWYNKVKAVKGKIDKNEAISDIEIHELEKLFEPELEYRRRKTFVDPNINVELLCGFEKGKHDLLRQLREKNIFILSAGAIESYYPSGTSGQDKPSKALNAIKLLKEDPSKFNQLPKVEISKENYEKEEKCELEVIFETIFNKT